MKLVTGFYFDGGNSHRRIINYIPGKNVNNCVYGLFLGNYDKEYINYTSKNS